MPWVRGAVSVSVSLVLSTCMLFLITIALGAYAPHTDTTPDGESAISVWLPIVAGDLDPESLKNAAATTHGAGHGCARTVTGAIKCWGQNTFGKLGDGTATDRLHAVDTISLSAGVKDVSAGYQHTCAVNRAGAVLCWGSNIFSQLGTGAFDNSMTPVQVSGLAQGFKDVRASERHSCALSEAGAVKCWGDNSAGILGNGVAEFDRRTPVDVIGLGGGVQSIALGTSHSCALLATGAVRCWGSGFFGQLGNGGNSSQFAPVQVSGLASGVKAIAAGGDVSCALLANGTVRCWGRNEGFLGTGSDQDELVPAPVLGLPANITAIAVAYSHACAVTADHEVYCWGSNAFGELGGGPSYDENGPVQVVGLDGGAKAVMVNNFYSCAVMRTLQVKCWGQNMFGQLGDGTSTDRKTPVFVRVVPL